LPDRPGFEPPLAPLEIVGLLARVVLLEHHGHLDRVALSRTRNLAQTSAWSSASKTLVIVFRGVPWRLRSVPLSPSMPPARSGPRRGPGSARVCAIEFANCSAHAPSPSGSAWTSWTEFV
jgi:hypothetical protein